MTKADLHWLAGLLEGEGSFFVAYSRNGGHQYPHARIEVSMTDKDVIQRAAKLLGATYRLQKWSTAATRHYKPIWKSSVYSANAVSHMLRLAPLMGRRRKRKIADVLRECRMTRARPWGKRHRRAA